ncbi:hypothetical protein JZU54_04635, partial [bacterium]|nr:hypothetical protein [bacterium]
MIFELNDFSFQIFNWIFHMTHFFKPSLAMSLIAVAVLTACGGGGGGNTAAATVSLAGVVA